MNPPPGQFIVLCRDRETGVARVSPSVSQSVSQPVRPSVLLLEKRIITVISILQANNKGEVIYRMIIYVVIYMGIWYVRFSYLGSWVFISYLVI